MAVDVETYYRKYAPMVLRRCRMLLKNEAEALDAMQEVFVKLMLNQDKFTDQYPSSLLFRMATNLCLNRIRSGRRRPELHDEALLSAIARCEATDAPLECRDWLDHLFKRLPPSTLEIAVLHYVDQMTLGQVAAEVGLSVSGVRKRLRGLSARVRAMKEQ